MLELVATGEAVESNKNEAQILLNEKVIKRLKEDGIFKGLNYIYLAIEIEKAENPNPKTCKIEIEDFCQRWGVKETAVRKALIDLDDIGVILITNPSIVQLSLI